MDDMTTPQANPADVAALLSRTRTLVREPVQQAAHLTAVGLTTAALTWTALVSDALLGVTHLIVLGVYGLLVIAAAFRVPRLTFPPRWPGWMTRAHETLRSGDLNSGAVEEARLVTRLHAERSPRSHWTPALLMLAPLLAQVLTGPQMAALIAGAGLLTAWQVWQWYAAQVPVRMDMVLGTLDLWDASRQTPRG